MAANSRKTIAIRREAKKLRSRMGSELCSLEQFKGAQMTVQDITSREHPNDPTSAFATARTWRKENWFVGAILGIKTDFTMYNQTLVARDRAQRKALAAWLEKEDDAGRATHQMQVERYIQTAIEEFLLNDNLVSFWREDTMPYPLEGERCRYSDALGKEVLKVRLGHTVEQLKAAGFDEKTIRRYTTGWLTLDEAEGEYFRVLTRNMVGNGFGYPRLHQVFRACSQAESMEIGESLYAYVGRTVVRRHLLGWEIKKEAGIRQTDAMWDAKRALGIEKYFKGLQGGVAETTGNFDHKIELLWTDPAKYDAKKWETIITRLQWWGGPLAFMLIARNLNPNFMPVFKAEIQRLRARLKPHLEYVINTALQPPGGLAIKWTDECFADMRLLWDMIKTMVVQGPTSLSTAQKFAGLDPEEEAEQKLAEANDTQSQKKYWPLFDASHGQRPGEPKAGGRTAGIKDGQGKGPGGE